MESICRASDQIDREAAALNIAQTAEWRRKEADDAKQREDRWHTQQLSTILDWLESRDSEQELKLEALRSRCYDGTCQWVTQSSKIRSWLQRGRGGSVLWLNGKPGSGKSVLSAKIIQFLRSDPHRRVCFFFCDYHTSSADVSATILRTVCAQIIRMAPNFVPYVYDECLGKAQRPTCDVLKKTLAQLFSQLEDLHLVVDGIDEVSSTEHRSLIKDLLQISTVNTGLKLLVVSQELPTISAHLSKKPTLRLREEEESRRKDFTIVIEGSLEELNDYHDGAIGEEMIERLKQHILNKAEGIFQVLVEWPGKN